MSRYVLVHASWHDGDCRADVAAELRAAGHEVHAPTLVDQGRGEVGHSYGGTIVSKLAELLIERIRRLFYWDAFALLDGESLYDVSPRRYNASMDADAAERGDGPAVLPYPGWRAHLGLHRLVQMPCSREAPSPTRSRSPCSSRRQGVIDPTARPAAAPGGQS